MTYRVRSLASFSLVATESSIEFKELEVNIVFDFFPLIKMREVSAIWEDLKTHGLVIKGKILNPVDSCNYYNYLPETTKYPEKENR